jgi:hypothetical protein
VAPAFTKTRNVCPVLLSAASGTMIALVFPPGIWSLARAKSPALSTPSSLGTSASTGSDREVVLTLAPMRLTRPTKVLPGKAATETLTWLPCVTLPISASATSIFMRSGLSRTTTTSALPTGANSPGETRFSATEPSNGALTAMSATDLPASPAAAWAPSSVAHEPFAPESAMSYCAFVCSARVRAASHDAWLTAPDSKSDLVRSASATARSIDSLAARTSGTSAGSNFLCGSSASLATA